MTEFHRRLAANRRVQRRMAACFIVALFILVSSLGVYLAIQFAPVQRSYIYPYAYQETVEKYAREYHTDSHLTAAVIKKESKFEPSALSHRGARGLMQIMPETGKWIALQLDDDDYSDDRLYEPELNIRYGTWYLALLEREFYGNEVLALAAYNAGHGNVEEWMEEYGWGPDFRNIDAIPFAETRDYVWQVLKDRQKYRELYPLKALQSN